MGRFRRLTHATAATLVWGLVAVSCGGDSSEAVIDPGDGGNYAPVLNPSDFVDRIDNPYLPLLPGATWVYDGDDDGERTRTEVVVTSDRRQILGISAVVVRDTVTVDGVLKEDTFDWFAQDGKGDVWYLGEATKDYEDGKQVSTEGSWEAGVDGAKPGIIMPARPAPGLAFRQEFDEGEAEDMGEVVRTDGTATVPFGRFDDLVVIREWNPLEAKVVEEKYFARGVGYVRGVVVAGDTGKEELVRFTPGT